MKSFRQKNLTPTNSENEAALVELKKGYTEAETLLKDATKLELFLQDLEDRLLLIPAVGTALSKIPVMIDLIRRYKRGEYPHLPVGSAIAILSALIYVVSPLDAIADVIPAVGYLDDAAVVAACSLLVKADIEQFENWKELNGI